MFQLSLKFLLISSRNFFHCFINIPRKFVKFQETSKSFKKLRWHSLIFVEIQETFRSAANFAKVEQTLWNFTKWTELQRKFCKPLDNIFRTSAIIVSDRRLLLAIVQIQKIRKFNINTMSFVNHLIILKKLFVLCKNSR